MAAFTGTPQIGVLEAKGGGTHSAFIPELWSDEIIASYKSNLVLGNLVRKMSMKGKKGDMIHVPKPTREGAAAGVSGATAKVVNTAVTLLDDTNTTVDILIDQHYEYSKMIEDIADVQALSSLRRFYTDDAGYSMAKQLDMDLFRLGLTLDGGAFNQDITDPLLWISAGTTFTVASGGGLIAYNGTTASTPTGLSTAFNSLSMRTAVQKLDDNDVPQTGRFFAIPPVLVAQMRGVDQFISEDFINGKPTQTGKVGDLYGVPIFVSTNVPFLTTDTSSNVERMTLLAHKDAYICAEQVGVRSQTQYKQEYLSTLLTSDRIYGVKAYRPEAAVVIAVDAG